MKIIKNTKTLFLILGFFFLGAALINADSGSGSVTVTVNPAVNGGWSGWSAQDNTCVLYSDQTKTQTRSCTNPSPSIGGADCSGSTTQTYVVPACVLDGGWSGWSAQDNTCAYNAQTKTQTRSCNNPTRSGTGADCSGSTTQTYVVPACLSNITSLSVSPNTVTYGSNASISYSCTNAYYTHLLLDWTWNSGGGWDYSGVYGSGTYATAALTSPGTHTLSAYCYNSDMVPSANSWTSTTFTVGPAPVNGVCSTTTHYSCNPGSTSVSNAEGPGSWTWGCNGANGGTNASSCSLAIPPPTNFTSTCSISGLTGSSSWTLPSGFTNSYFRVSDTTTGTAVDKAIPENVTDTGPSTSFPTTPGHSYTTWVHTRLPGGYSNAVFSNFACAPQNNLTITSPGGISGTYSASGTYAVNNGASPIVTAAAWAGYSVAISGGCTASGGVGATANCTVSNMTSAKTVTVVYTDAISPIYNSTSFTECNYESGNNCYVKNGTTFYVNISHTDNESGSNNQYFELSKNGANRGTWDGLTGNIKSYAVPYGVNNGNYYTSYGEGGGMEGAGYFDIKNAQCIQSPNCNYSAVGKWQVVAGAGASGMYGVTVYMYDQAWNGVGYTATSKYVYLDNDAPSIPTPTDDGTYVASPTLNFYASPSDASSGLSACSAQIDVNNTDGVGLALNTTAIGATGNYSWTGSAGNTYYYRYFCTDKVGNSSGWSSWSDGVSISTIPTVTTKSPITSITQTTAVGGGTIVSNGGATVTTSGIAWSTSPNPTIASSRTTDGWATGGPWTSTAMTGLTPNTTYHVRAYAINSAGTSYGTDVTFVTTPANCSVFPFLPNPMVSGNSVTAYSIPTPPGPCISESRTCTNGTLSGSYTQASCTAGCTGTPWGNVSTTYSNTAYLASSVPFPETCTSQTRTCTAGTLSGSYTNTTCIVTSILPTVTTKSPITSITQTTAVGGGTIVSNGGATVTTSGIAWSTSPNPTIASSRTTDGWATGGPWTSTAMTGLTPNTTYHVRAYAINSAGTSYGTDVTFVTTGYSVSIIASPTSYNTIPSTNVSILYTPTTNTGNTECRLLDSTSIPLPPATYKLSTPTNNSITFTPPVSAGAYGYYVQCRNTIDTTVIATSALITVTVFIVTTTASPLTYNVAPGALVNLVYNPISNPSGLTECLLFDSVLAPLTGYQLASPISYTVPNSIGAYSYYVKCRNTATTIAMANSAKITVNTACGVGTSWNGTACVAPSGSISVNSGGCSITMGNSSCNVSLTWNTVTPIGTSSVTTPSFITVATGNSDTNIVTGSKTYSVSYGSRNFFLYNNGNQIGTTATATATCTGGTVWGSGVCQPPTGTLTATGCMIPLNGTSCLTTLTWDTINPLISPLTNSVVKNITDGTTIATGNSNGTIVTGSSTYSLTPISKTFELWHNGVLLLDQPTQLIPARATPVAVCANNTHWSVETCVIDPPITTFKANPTTIFSGRSSTLTWNSPLATSCTGTGFNIDPDGDGITKNGSLIVSPLVTTTYTLKCINSSGTDTIVQTTKVITLIIKEQ